MRSEIKPRDRQQAIEAIRRVAARVKALPAQITIDERLDRQALDAIGIVVADALPERGRP